MSPLGDMNAFVFLIDGKITFFRFVFLCLSSLLQTFHDVSEFNVQVTVLANSTRDNQRCSGFINQDGVDFIDDGKIRRTLYFFFGGKRHVIAQIIKAEFVVGAVGNVCCVSLLFRDLIQTGNTDAGSHAQEVIQTPHPFGITRRQIVIDGNHVHTLAGQCVKVGSQCGDQGFTFTGFHLGDLATVQYHAADQLYIKVTHA